MSASDKEMVQKSSSSGSRTGMWVAVAVVLIVIILVVVGFEAGWFGSKSSNPGTSSCTGSSCVPSCTVPSGQTVVGAGSTFVYPLMYVWQSSYTASTISYNSVGSGTGISDLGQKTVDFAASDAPLSPAQRVTDPNAITMPESAGSVAIIYNVAGVPTLHFNGSVLAKIYLGTITTWNDPEIAALNTGVTLPSASIGVVHRSDGSGTSFAFTEFLSSDSSQWKTQVGYSTSPVWPVGTGQPKSGGVANYVLTTPNTIGYVDLEYALSTGLAFGAVQNPAGDYVLPSLNSTANALKNYTGTLPSATDGPAWYNVSIENMPGFNSYPIATFTYLLSYQALDTLGSSFTASQANAMLSFWNWTIHAGQQYSAEYYYTPLPANIVTADQAELAAFTYSGSAVTHC